MLGNGSGKFLDDGGSIEPFLVPQSLASEEAIPPGVHHLGFSVAMLTFVAQKTDRLLEGHVLNP
jgi:hypothetical protein